MQLSSFDLLRFVVPGGVVVVLTELALRVFRNDMAVAVVVDDVGFALFLAFGSGIVLYFIDVPYATPQFWKGIPSQYFQEEVIKLGISRDVAEDKALGVFLVEIEHLAPSLHQRSLLFGALYRIGFQLVFFLIITGVAIPVTLLVSDELMRGSTFGISDPTKVAWIVPGFLVLLTVALLRTFRPLLRDTARSAARKILASPLLVRELAPKGVRSFVILCSTAGVIGWVAGWALIVGDVQLVGVTLPHEPSQGRWLIALTSALSVVAWGFPRLVGPLRAWWTYVRTLGGRKPDRPHTGSQIDSLDTAVVLGPMVALVITGDHLSVPQIATLSLLVAIALWLAHLRKFERQLHGIYRNQRDWIDRNMPRLISTFDDRDSQPLAASSRSTSVTQGESSLRGWLISGLIALAALTKIRKWMRRELGSR